MLELTRDSSGLRKCRIDEWASVCDAPTAIPSRMGLDAYVCRGMSNMQMAVEYADSISARFAELGAPEEVFVVAGPTSTTSRSYEVVSATAGYTVLHATRPEWGSILKQKLAAMTRHTQLAGVVPDPVAQQILASQYLRGLEHQLRRLGVGRLEEAVAVGAGASSVVFGLGAKVIRLGLGELPDRPPVVGVLQPELSCTLGDLRFEVLPRVDTSCVTEEHLQMVQAYLAAQGYEWGDAGIDNIGLMDGAPVVFDSHGIRQASDDSHQRARCPGR